MKQRGNRNPTQQPVELPERIPHALPKDVTERLPFAWQAIFSVEQKKGKTNKELKEIRLEDVDHCPLNPGLILDKYLPHLEKLDDIKGGKGHLVLGIARHFNSNSHLDRYRPILDACHGRQSALLNALAIQRPGTACDGTVSATVVWRMVVGIGRPHVWENALALHPLYGFPYIPGSSVKGLVRLAAFWDIAAALNLEPRDTPEGSNETRLARLDRLLIKATDKAAWQSAGFPDWNGNVFDAIQVAQALFGTVGRRGRGIFLDALPEAFPKIETDIMNPHFQEYYQQGPRGTQPPSDDLEPKPIFFLTVGKETRFSFPLAVLQGEPNAEKLLAKAICWLTRAITEFGVGAKTRAGYGELNVETELPSSSP